MTPRRSNLLAGKPGPNAFVGLTATKPVQTSLPIAGQRSEPAALAQTSEKRQRTPGTTMTREEFSATADVRRALVESMGHLAWSKLTDAGRDEAVRKAVRNGL